MAAFAAGAYTNIVSIVAIAVAPRTPARRTIRVFLIATHRTRGFWLLDSRRVDGAGPGMKALVSGWASGVRWAAASARGGRCWHRFDPCSPLWCVVEAGAERRSGHVPPPRFISTQSVQSTQGYGRVVGVS